MVDLIAQVDSAPEPGETVLGRQLDTQPGGKGFNQAIAAARLGCPVDFIARVGDDVQGRLFFETLDRHAIGRAHVSTTPTRAPAPAW
jgi:ribokinase